MASTEMFVKILFAALTFIMFGLGLSLKVEDFRRLLGAPRAVVIALTLQILVLPAACYGIVIAFGLPPIYGMGLMLLAASPGGISANIFSHLFGGNVAMNISLTAINTLLSIVSMPLIANLAISALGGNDGQVIPIQTAKLAEVIATVLVPVVLGMATAAIWPRLARALDVPMRILSAVVLATITVGAIVKEWSTFTSAFGDIGPAVVTFNLISLFAGYYVSRAGGVASHDATAISFEIGIHNSPLAMYLAANVLGSIQLALPAAFYSAGMYVFATLFGILVLRRSPLARRTVAQHRRGMEPTATELR